MKKFMVMSAAAAALVTGVLMGRAEAQVVVRPVPVPAHSFEQRMLQLESKVRILEQRIQRLERDDVGYGRVSCSLRSNSGRSYLGRGNDQYQATENARRSCERVEGRYNCVAQAVCR